MHGQHNNNYIRTHNGHFCCKAYHSPSAMYLLWYAAVSVFGKNVIRRGEKEIER